MVIEDVANAFDQFEGTPSNMVEVFSSSVFPLYKGKTERQHIAVIGDGGMTGGISFEGMNHAGDSRVEDIARQLAMRRRFLTTKDVMKACPRLKIGKNRIGTKVKDFRRIVKKAKALNIFKPLLKLKSILCAPKVCHKTFQS